MRFRSLRWPQYYYAATIGFALIDWVAGANLRAVGFAAHPQLRVVYYLICLFCGLASRLRPAWSAPVTLVESTINLTTLMIALLSPYYVFALRGHPEALLVSPGLVVNFVIAGSAGVVAFYQSLWALPGGPRGDRRVGKGHGA